MNNYHSDDDHVDTPTISSDSDEQELKDHIIRVLKSRQFLAESDPNAQA